MPPPTSAPQDGNFSIFIIVSGRRRKNWSSGFALLKSLPIEIQVCKISGDQHIIIDLVILITDKHN